MILNETFFNMMVYFFFAKGVFELGMSVKSQITEYHYRKLETKQIDIEEADEVESVVETVEDEVESVVVETIPEVETIEEVIEVENIKIDLIHNVINTTQELIENVLKCMKDSENKVIIESILKIIFKLNEKEQFVKSQNISPTENVVINTTNEHSVIETAEEPSKIDPIWNVVKEICSDNSMVIPIIADTHSENITPYTGLDYTSNHFNGINTIILGQDDEYTQSKMISSFLNYNENRDTAQKLIYNILKFNDNYEQSKVLLEKSYSQACDIPPEQSPANQISSIV